jgi:hypothetical protein
VVYEKRALAVFVAEEVRGVYNLRGREWALYEAEF